MTNPRIAPILSFCLFGLLACGGSQAHPVDARATAPDLTGHWRSACVAQPQGDGSTLYAVLDLVAGQTDRWTLDYILHGDAGCTMKLVTVAIRGGYALTEPSPTVTGAWLARFGFEDKTITPHAQPLVDALTGAGCGSAAWAVGASQSVYAAGCPAFGQYPQAACEADFDLASSDGQTLRFGARPTDNNLCTIDRRPAKLADLALVKQ